MKTNDQLNVLILARQLLAENDSAPEEVIAKLLSELADMRQTLDLLHQLTIDQPIESKLHRSAFLRQAISGASLHLLMAFSQCGITNGILSKVRFHDGLYELTFQRIV